MVDRACINGTHNARNLAYDFGVELACVAMLAALVGEIAGIKYIHSEDLCFIQFGLNSRL